MFKSGDDTTRLTRLMNPWGGISFHRGHLTAESIHRNGQMTFRYDKDGNGQINGEVFELENVVDTLVSLYTNSIYPPPKEQEYEGVWFVVDELVEDAAHAHILRDFGIEELRPNAVYHLSPVERGKQHQFDGFTLYIIDEWKTETSTITCLVGAYNNEGEFQLKKRKSIDLSKRKRKLVGKGLREIQERDIPNCLRPGERGKIDLIYFGSHKYLLSGDCMRMVKEHRNSRLVKTLLPAYLGSCCED